MKDVDLLSPFLLRRRLFVLAQLAPQVRPQMVRPLVLGDRPHHLLEPLELLGRIARLTLALGLCLARHGVFQILRDDDIADLHRLDADAPGGSAFIDNSL